MTRAYTEARDACFEELFEIASHDKDVILLTADTGAFAFQRFRAELPDQFFNVGIAEQNAMTVAAGLALSGKRVFVFGISNFVTLRCFEQIKLDICCMDLPVTIIGMGTGYVYPKDGPTHHMTDILSLVRTLPGLTVWSPSDYSIIAAAIRSAIGRTARRTCTWTRGRSMRPIRRMRISPMGWRFLRSGRDVTLVATGVMVAQAMRVATRLTERGIDAGVIDLYRIKPLNVPLLERVLAGSRRVVTVEENSVIGGLGSLVCETVAEAGLPARVKRLGIQDTYRCDISDREGMRALDGLDLEGIERTVCRWMDDDTGYRTAPQPLRSVGSRRPQRRRQTSEVTR
jgi:transketolase